MRSWKGSCKCSRDGLAILNKRVTHLVASAVSLDQHGTVEVKAMKSKYRDKVKSKNEAT